jgi:DNA-binding GntR family transcriptional regulator
LRQLESEGLVTFQRNRGITVSKLSIKAVDEIYTLRCLLESYAANLSAKRSTPKHAIFLKGLQKNLITAAGAFDLKTWIDNNTLFHNFFSDHCDNNNLRQILDTLKRRVYRYQYIILRIPGHFESYLNHHEAIISACEQRDGAVAERYMRLHLERVKNVLIEYLHEFHSVYSP